MAYKNIVLIGAGGNLGPHILKSIQHDGSFNITILTRQSSKSTFPSSVKVIKVPDDYPVKALEEAFQGQDAVISLVGSSALKDQTKFIDAAVKAKVKRFFPSDFGSNLRDPRTIEIAGPIFQPKLDIEKYLRAHEKELSWTSIVTGPFFDWGVQVGFLGFNTQAKSALIFDSGDNLWSGTNLSTIGKAVISLLKNPQSGANQLVYIASVTTSQNEVLAALEQVSGAKYSISKTSVKETEERGKAKLQKGDFSGAGDLILANLYSGAGTDFTKEGLLNEKLGLPKETVLDTVKHVIKGELAP